MGYPHAPAIAFVLAPASRPASPTHEHTVAVLESKVKAADAHRRRTGSLHSDCNWGNVLPTLVSASNRGGAWDVSPWSDEKVTSTRDESLAWAWEGIPRDEEQLREWASKKERSVATVAEPVGAATSSSTGSSAPTPSTSKGTKHTKLATLIAGGSMKASKPSLASNHAKASSANTPFGRERIEAGSSGDSRKGKQAVHASQPDSAETMPSATIKDDYVKTNGSKRNLAHDEEILFELGNTQMEIPPTSPISSPVKHLSQKAESLSQSASRKPTKRRKSSNALLRSVAAHLSLGSRVDAPESSIENGVDDVEMPLHTPLKPAPISIGMINVQRKKQREPLEPHSSLAQFGSQNSLTGEVNSILQFLHEDAMT